MILYDGDIFGAGKLDRVSFRVGIFEIEKFDWRDVVLSVEISEVDWGVIKSILVVYVILIGGDGRWSPSGIGNRLECVMIGCSGTEVVCK